MTLNNLFRRKWVMEAVGVPRIGASEKKVKMQ
jgi:hypothetical protein